jgi:PilZ domain-containing protein
MQHHMRHTPVDQSGRWWWHPRTCGRRPVTLRVDYATADGRGWQGLIRNLSLQGIYIDTVLCQGTPTVAPGDRLTVAFVLPSGQPCKLRAIVIHGGRHGCGVQFLEGQLQAFAHLASYWSAPETKQAL